MQLLKLEVKLVGEAPETFFQALRPLRDVPKWAMMRLLLEIVIAPG